MPKRKGATRFSGVAPGSDDEDLMEVNETQEERPKKKARGRPRSKSTEAKPPAQTKKDSEASPAEPTMRKGTRRGRPKSSRISAQAAEAQEPEKTQDSGNATKEDDVQVGENGSAAIGQADDAQDAPKPKKPGKPAKSTGTRGRKKGSAGSQLKTDGEFEYTPTVTRQTKSPTKAKEQPPAGAQPKRQQRKTRMQAEAEAEAPETEDEATNAPEEVEETMLQEGPVVPRAASSSPTKRRQSTQRSLLSSPTKRRSGLVGDEEQSGGEPELRRRIGELTRKCDTLESRYRTLKEIGVVEANSTVDKLRKQCESVKIASDNVIASLKEELGAQKALGQQSRALQQQLDERDAEIAQLRSQAEEASSQVTSAQTEAKALKTKLAAARNTAASLENAAIKVPGSAIKGGAANRANAAANAEAVQAAQFAQLKEDLYSDLTGLIIRDVKRREADNLYDCIQTGINGTLHFKLAVPLDEAAANFETAEFQYIPLLDANRDRELVDILPEYLTVDITFARQQASKFYTRVIDALTKRRNSSTR